MKPIPLNKIGAAVIAANAHLLGTVPGVAIGYTSTGPIVTNRKPAPAPTKARKPRRPTKTENAAIAHLKALGYTDIRWNAVTFKLANGHRYTPDLTAMPAHQGPAHLGSCDDVLTIFEVKGSYRLGSLQRSRLAFDQARLEWPQFDWKWMERTKDKGWRIE